MILNVQKTIETNFHNKLIKIQNYTNNEQTPNIKKIIVYSLFDNNFDKNFNLQKNIINDYFLFTFFKPKLIKVKHAVSIFNTRKNDNIGLKVILNKKDAWLFLTKLIFIVLPQIRELPKWSKKNFDKFGNFSFGLQEQLIFPEIGYNEERKIFGLNVTIVFSSNIIKDNLNMLNYLNFPLS